VSHLLKILAFRRSYHETTDLIRNVVGYTANELFAVPIHNTKRRSIMKKSIKYVGLDVHSEFINSWVSDSEGSDHYVGHFPNRPESVRRHMRKLGKPEQLRVCYEAGCMGYELYWQLTSMDIQCDVIAPTLIPVKRGDRVKTNRRDAKHLSLCHRAGTLTPIWVPDREHEALRDLVRAREAAKSDQRRARQRLKKFLLRHGQRQPAKMKSWTLRYMAWLRTIKFDHLAHRHTMTDYLYEVDHSIERIDRLEREIDEVIKQSPLRLQAIVAGLQAFRGVSKTTAVGIAAEVGTFLRFEKPAKIMGYVGNVPSEYSSGLPGYHCRGPITKTGNTHLRRLVTESAWSYRHGPGIYPVLKRRQEGLPEEVKQIAWRAQTRLCGRYRKLTGRGKEKNKVVTAIGRELLSFLWEAAVVIEQTYEQELRKAA